MTSDKLENLVRIGRLKKEPPSASELAGLKRSGLACLADAERSDLSFESCFDLAYNAAHALALFALRRMGYRPENRYLVFKRCPRRRVWLPATGGCWLRRTKNAISSNTRATWRRTSACWPMCSLRLGI